MKTLFATLAAATAVAAIAAPAAAQSYGWDGRYDRDGRYEQRHDGAYSINRRQAELRQRIEWGQRRGTLDRREAANLYEYSRYIDQVEARYRHRGLTWSERNGLDSLLDKLETRISREAHDRDYSYRPHDRGRW